MSRSERKQQHRFFSDFRFSLIIFYEFASPYVRCIWPVYLWLFSLSVVIGPFGSDISFACGNRKCSFICSNRTEESQSAFQEK